MTYDTDVIVIGAGAGGSVAAYELGKKGIKVLLLEAGPWYGNKKWPNPNQEPNCNQEHSTMSSTNSDDLNIDIFDKHITNYEGDMNDIVTGKFRWGPADRSKNAWPRRMSQEGFVWQNSGVGGTTKCYFANSPRAFPVSMDNIWPIPYSEIIPYYEKVEKTLPVNPAPMTAKEELFFYGAKKSGWSLLETQNVTSPGYRPQPNAILGPNSNITDSNFIFEKDNEGCTLCGNCLNGCNIGPSVDKIAKRSTLVSYIPLALKTGNVEVRPNTFVIKILTQDDKKEGLKTIGVKYRDTWTGKIGEIKSRVVIMAAGAVESPRLWLNSKLPDNPWVGKGLTSHYVDCIAGIFDEKDLMSILGTSDVKPFVGQNSAARFDYPGIGAIEDFGASPAIFSTLIYSSSIDGYNFLRKPGENQPWDIRGRVVGEQLKELMKEYQRTLCILTFTDDEVDQKNEVTLDPLMRDENGLIPVVKYEPSQSDIQKRDKLAVVAADILRNAGAKKIIRTDCTPGLFIHMQSTMRMGYVTDTNCEVGQVKRLFIADNSVLYNSLGGANPTLTTQALATRTAEKIISIYFS